MHAAARCRIPIYMIAFSFVGGCGNVPESSISPIDYEDVIPQLVPAAEPYQDISEEFDLIGSSGARLYGLIRRPDPQLYPRFRFPAVVLIPGGINPGRSEAESPDAELLCQAGVVTVVTGCVARHPELPIKCLVDGEGPSRSYVTCHEPRTLDDDPGNDKHETILDILGHYSTARDSSEANLEFWAAREAVEFIGKLRGRYLRLQAQWDHIQPPFSDADAPDFECPPEWWHNKHTTEMVAAALDGGVPRVMVNLPAQGNQINDRYSFAQRPVFIPGILKESSTPWYALAMAAMSRKQSLDPLE